MRRRNGRFGKTTAFILSLSMVVTNLAMDTSFVYADTTTVEGTETQEITKTKTETETESTEIVAEKEKKVTETDDKEIIPGEDVDALINEVAGVNSISMMSLDGGNNAIQPTALDADNSFEDFTEDTVIGDFKFGSDITSSTLYNEETGYGFSDVDYSTEAAGWVNNVYIPREANVTEGAASYVSDSTDSLAIGSRVWTETESSGYGVYTYETTSTFDVNAENADYKVEVTLVNPTQADYKAYLEAENITKVSDITVAAGAVVEASFTAVVTDGKLNLKFPVASSATTMSDAAVLTAYVSEVKVTRLATNEAGSKPTIFIASDSTVQTYDDYYYPQTGWGQVLAEFFGDNLTESECDACNYSQSQTYETDNVVIENRSIGGRSSKSFIEEGKLDDLLEDVKPGDYVLVQWGHNDATYSRPNRYVSAADFEQWMMVYVNGALQRGATPVLVTPVARYSYTTDAEGALVSFASNFESYRQVMLKIAAEYSVPYVDLTQRSIDVCNDFGIEGSKSLFLQLAAGDYEGYYSGGASDATHLQYYGAYKFAQCVAEGILEYTDTSALDALKSSIDIKKKTVLPGNIQGLATSTVGASSISLTWQADDETELYYIYRAELEDGQTVADVDFTDAKKYSVTSKNKYTDSACTSGKTYVYAIRGFNSLGMSESFSEMITVSTKTAGYKFDFNYNGSPTADGYIGIESGSNSTMYDAATGYGWITSPNNGRYRSNNGNADSSDMADDFGLGDGEFAVDLPNGDYEVTVYACDLLSNTSTIKPAYTAEGLSIGSISCKQSLGSTTSTVRVEDGQLNLVIGGTNKYINGLTITEILRAPSGLNYTEMSISGTNASFLLGFNTVSEADSYRVYRKSSSDADYALVKSFTAEEYKEDELGCRAMAASLGETYSYYMTCVTADGAESAASNVIEIEVIDKTIDYPAIPQNLVCEDPTADTTTLQHSITISWDAVETAYKYVIYRSDKAEDEKGFKEFKKVGEASTNSYTDTEEGLATNISYYYKVCAVNARGLGEVSEACKTPVTGELVAGGREKYTDRALVAVNLAGDDGAETSLSATDSEGNEITEGVYLSWRSFEEDFDAEGNLEATFDVYCNNKIIAENIAVTNMVYEGGKATDVYKVVGSTDSSQKLKAIETSVWNEQYLELDLFCPEDDTMPDELKTTCSYSANDMSVADLDGDGQLELIVKWYPSNAKDNSFTGFSGKTFIDGYDIDFSTGKASLLWRIDLGVNIRSGAHYTQFQVWDFDGDGAAEIAVKTADGTTTYTSKDGTVEGLVETKFVGECNSSALPIDTISEEYDYRNSSGYVLSGPEYFTIFNGNDGTIIDTADYTPARGTVSAWGDAYGNRVDRFLSATAYLDGETPFAVFARGYYTRTCLTAYYLEDTDEDGIGDKIATYWTFDTDVAGTQYEGQGNHGLSVNDVDNDGKDEIIYGALTIDNDGTVKYSTNLGHGDAMHVSDWVSWNDGLEVMGVHEHDNVAYHVEIHDAETGEVIMGYYTGKDTGRGVAADIDPTAEGAEFWSIASPSYDSDEEPAWNSTAGEVFSTASTVDKLIALSDDVTPPSNFSIFWDGDLLSEVQDLTFDSAAYAPIGVTIEKWNYENQKSERIFYSEDIFTSNGTKGNLGLVADILGDWREEIIARSSEDSNKVRIYTTTIQTDYVVPCLLEDLAYREGIAWQNVGYNQPANTSYLLSEGLVTAQLTAESAAKNSVTFTFTPASDGVNGHAVTGYEILRANVASDGTVGDYEVIDTVDTADLTVVEDADTTRYSYTDSDLASKKTFSYKVAAIVDGKASFMSRPVELSTMNLLVSIETIPTQTIVENTPVAEESTPASLLQQTVKGTDVSGEVDVHNIIWDITGLDITTVGTYTVYASVKGYESEPVAVTVEVTANAVKSVDTVSKVRMIEGSELVLPETVTITYTNTTTEEAAVTWDTSKVDVNTIGSYDITGTVEGISELAETTVIVTENYVTSVENVYAEIPYLCEDVAAALPATVNAKFANGTTGTANVSWDVTSLDVKTIGNYEVAGSVEGFDENVVAKVSVAYAPLYKFDFGISASNVADGWIGITVNGKGGSKTMEQLGSHYTTEKGYGFEDATATTAGRSEGVSKEGVIPEAVYNDFALCAGQTFLVDVPNGTYQVDIMSNSYYKSTVKAVIEGGSEISISNAAESYEIGSSTAIVEDGQLNITFTTGVARMGAIIVRQVVETVETPEDPTIIKDSVEFEDMTAVYGEDYTVEAVVTDTETYPDCSISYIFEGAEGTDYTASTVKPVNAGTYSVKATIGNGIYACEITKTLTITQKEVTVSGITAEDKEYDGTTNAVLNFENAVIAGVIEGDSLSVTAEGAYADAEVGTEKTVTIQNISLEGDSLANYVLAEAGQQESATAAIVKSTAIAEAVTFEDLTVVYGDSYKVKAGYSGRSTYGRIKFTYSFVGIGSTVYKTNARQPVNAGTYAMSVTAENDCYKATITKTLTIEQKEVTVSGIRANDKYYDGTTDAVLDYTWVRVQGLKSGDEVEVSATGTFSDATIAFNKEVTISDITLSGEDSANYKLAEEGQQTVAYADIKSEGKNPIVEIIEEIWNGFIGIIGGWFH